jgi:hypothetical protein
LCRQIQAYQGQEHEFSHRNPLSEYLLVFVSCGRTNSFFRPAQHVGGYHQHGTGAV